MQSMTGFGSSETFSDEMELQIQLRCVNSRFLEIRCHLPKEYLAEELPIKKLLAEYFQRGHLDLYVHKKVRYSQVRGRVEVHQSMMTSYLQQLKKVSKTVGLDPGSIMANIAQLPQFVNVEVQQTVSRKEKSELYRVLREAADQCALQREKEGAKLQKDLLQILKSLLKLSKDMEKARKVSEGQWAELREQRWQELSEKLSFDQAKYVLEFLALEKMDVSEELTRLQGHVEECTSLLKSSEPVGKRLDFFAQELLREVNTVGSKSQDRSLTRLVVEAKGVIEKFREQVQNLE